MDNKEQVIANDKDIERQVPGILQDRLPVQEAQKIESNRAQELWFRATNKG